MSASDSIGHWEAFYLASAGAAAVLLGLVFVGLSLHFERRSESDSVRGLAIQSASSLLYALLFSLIMLVPSGQPISQATGLIVVGLFGTWTVGTALLQAQRAGLSVVSIGLRFALPLAAMVVSIIAGASMAADWRPALWMTAAVVFLNIVVGTQNAWDLLLGVSDRPLG